MQKSARTMAFLGLAALVPGAGAAFASPADVEWARDAAGVLAGTLALSAATLLTLSILGGWRAALRFMAGTVAISWLAEGVGLKGGWLFGSAYAYHPGIRPLLPGGVPLFIPLAWFSLAGLPVVLLSGWKTARADGRLDAGRVLAKSAWSALGMVACDLALDPVAVSLGLWTWARPGPYFGVPWLNFAGWGAVSFLVFLAGYGWAGLGRAAAGRLPLRHELAWGAAGGALLVLMGVGVRNRIGSCEPLVLAMAAMLPLSLFWLARLHARVRAVRPRFLRARGGGPILRKTFSTAWKTFFHPVEYSAHFFHALRNFSAFFPRNGKNVSTPWKNREARGSARRAGFGGAGEGRP